MLLGQLFEDVNLTLHMTRPIFILCVREREEGERERLRESAFRGVSKILSHYFNSGTDICSLIIQDRLSWWEPLQDLDQMREYCGIQDAEYRFFVRSKNICFYTTHFIHDLTLYDCSLPCGVCCVLLFFPPLSFKMLTGTSSLMPMKFLLGRWWALISFPHIFMLNVI